MLHRLREPSIIVEDGANSTMAIIARGGTAAPVPLNYSHGSSRASKRRRLLAPCEFGRNIGSGGFLDTCRHCGHQILRKAQSRPRICLQCEKKRATPIHDRCKDCREPIVRSNVRKARICQKCKKSREKPNPTSHGIPTDPSVVAAVAAATAGCDGPFAAHPLLPACYLASHRLPQHLSSRRIYAANHWLQLPPQQHQLVQYPQQLASVPSMGVTSNYSGRALMHPMSHVLTREGPYCISAASVTNHLQSVAALTPDMGMPFHGSFSEAPYFASHQNNASSSSGPSLFSNLPRIQTENFHTPEDIVAYLKDRVSKRLTFSPSLSMTQPMKSSTSSLYKHSSTTRRARTSSAPILVPQVNPFQIRDCSSVVANAMAVALPAAAPAGVVRPTATEEVPPFIPRFVSATTTTTTAAASIDNETSTPKRIAASVSGTEKLLEGTTPMLMRLKSDSTSLTRSIFGEGIPATLSADEEQKYTELSVAAPNTENPNSLTTLKTGADATSTMTTTSRISTSDVGFGRCSLFGIKDEQSDYVWAGRTPRRRRHRLSEYMSPLTPTGGKNSAFIMHSSPTPPHLKTEAASLTSYTPPRHSSLFSSDRLGTLKLLLYPRDLPISTQSLSPLATTGGRGGTVEHTDSPRDSCIKADLDCSEAVNPPNVVVAGCDGVRSGAIRSSATTTSQNSDTQKEPGVLNVERPDSATNVDQTIHPRFCNGRSREKHSSSLVTDGPSPTDDFRAASSSRRSLLFLQSLPQTVSENLPPHNVTAGVVS